MNVTAPLFEPITPGDARAWTPPQGRADIAPSRYERIYLTIDAHWVVPALLRSAPIEGRAWSRPPARSRTTARQLASASSQPRDALWADPRTKH